MAYKQRWKQWLPAQWFVCRNEECPNVRKEVRMGALTVGATCEVCRNCMYRLRRLGEHK